MIKIDSSLHTIPYNSSNRGMEAGAAYPEEDSGLIPDDEDIFDDPASETAETPSPFSRRNVLPDPPLEETLPAFGGYIRSAADEGGYPTIDFLVRTDDEASGVLDRYFRAMDRMTLDSYGSFSCLRYSGADGKPRREGSFTCFRFNRPRNARSLRETLLSGVRLDSRQILIRLLEQILRFQEAVRLYGPFETDTGRVLSLSCLSLDTVYCSMKGRKLEHISILPLRCLPGSYDYPAELPREAGRRSCTEKTDVYAAACIAAEIANWTPDGVRMKSLPSSCAGLLTECLSPFPELRPAAASVLDALRAPEEGGAVSVPSGSSWLQSLRQGVNKIAGAARDAMSADPDTEDPEENRRRPRPERDEDQ